MHENVFLLFLKILKNILKLCFISCVTSCIDKKRSLLFLPVAALTIGASGAIKSFASLSLLYNFFWLGQDNIIVFGAATGDYFYTRFEPLFFQYKFLSIFLLQMLYRFELRIFVLRK